MLVGTNKLIALTTLTLTTYGQDKYNYVHFNKLTEVEGTKYVIASIENWGKMLETKSRYLLFINTKTGETNQVDFPIDAGIGKVEQIKLDSLGINLIVVAARTVDLDGKSGIDWNDPTQLIIVMTAGFPFAGIALKVPELYAVKVARTVLRGRKLPGAVRQQDIALMNMNT